MMDEGLVFNRPVAVITSNVDMISCFVLKRQCHCGQDFYQASSQCNSPQ